jgi:gliding motility-associated-like protein
LKKLVLIVFLISSLISEAAHLVGGEISYECTGNNTYLITLKVYRDCNSTGAPFDPNAYIAIFNGSTGLLYTSVSPSISSTILLPTTVSNPCLQTPPNVCTEMAIYTASVVLPASIDGYTITYQRCCRNQTISNIPNPGTWGSTFFVRVPPNDTTCNSSPEFLSNPPIVLCSNDPLNINSAAAESDGDSLYYQLCSPKHGGSQNNPRPSPQTVPPTSPPYQNVPFGLGFSATNPIPSNPPVQINPQTGIITGTPTQVGQYVVAICVSEYRNGQLLSTVTRDYQFNVTNCQRNVAANMNVSTQYCTGTTVSLTNSSINGTNYHWDFGDPNTLSDTSNVTSPTYTYSDTGTYDVTLIVNPGWPCTDTIVKTIKVHYPANASFNFSGPLCLEGGAVTFNTTSNNTGLDTYQWNFGPDAVPSTSTMRDPQSVSYNQAGAHPVSLTVNSFGCIKTVWDTVKIYEKPSIDFEVPQQIGCAPFTVDFIDLSTAGTTILYEWDFGDGNQSNLPNPSHTYQNPGTYDVSLIIYVPTGCTDTLELFRPALVQVNPTPISSVRVTPRQTSIYNPTVEVTDLAAKAGEVFYTDMGDGSVYSNTPSFFHQYRDTGTYIVKHVVGNTFSCADTAYVTVEIQPEPLIFAPNAFTPNNDGDNDIYKPSIVGSKEYKFFIYSRWGDVVFQTEDPNEGWNGLKFNTGSMLPEGVYTYSIFMRDLNNRVAEKKGYITLMR